MSPQSIYKIYGLSVHLFHGRLFPINGRLQSSYYYIPIKGIFGHDRLLSELSAILNIIPMAFHYIQIQISLRYIEPTVIEPITP